MHSRLLLLCCRRDPPFAVSKQRPRACVITPHPPKSTHFFVSLALFFFSWRCKSPNVSRSIFSQLCCTIPFFILDVAFFFFPWQREIWWFFFFYRLIHKDECLKTGWKGTGNIPKLFTEWCSWMTDVEKKKGCQGRQYPERRKKIAQAQNKFFFFFISAQQIILSGSVRCNASTQQRFFAN